MRGFVTVGRLLQPLPLGGGQGYGPGGRNRKGRQADQQKWITMPWGSGSCRLVMGGVNCQALALVVWSWDTAQRSRGPRPPVDLLVVPQRQETPQIWCADLLRRVAGRLTAAPACRKWLEPDSVPDVRRNWPGGTGSYGHRAARPGLAEDRQPRGTFAKDSHSYIWLSRWITMSSALEMRACAEARLRQARACAIGSAGPSPAL